MVGKRTRKEMGSTEISKIGKKALVSEDQASTTNGTEKQEPPHCPAELVKALRRQGIRVNVAGPLEERINNDLMMEGWHGKHSKDKE